MSAAAVTGLGLPATRVAGVLGVTAMAILQGLAGGSISGPAAWTPIG